MPVLDRILGASYLVNFIAHDRSAQGTITTGELTSLVAHLDELRAALRCEKCEKLVWHATTDGGRGHQCQCSGLALSA